MYNWSVDEKKFKNIGEIIKFLKEQPEVISVKISDGKDKYSNMVIKTELKPKIHPAREFSIAKTLQDRMGGMKISIIEAKKLRKEIF